MLYSGTLHTISLKKNYSSNVELLFLNPFSPETLISNFISTLPASLDFFQEYTCHSSIDNFYSNEYCLYCHNNYITSMIIVRLGHVRHIST